MESQKSEKRKKLLKKLLHSMSKLKKEEDKKIMPGMSVTSEILHYIIVKLPLDKKSATNPTKQG